MTSPVAEAIPLTGIVEKTRVSTPKKLNIVSVDGGGVKGILPATILAEIEKITEMQTAQLFDVMGGVSTGGIVTLSLNVQENGTPIYSAQEVVNIFREECPRVFPPDRCKIVQDVENLWEPKYSSEPLQQLADQRLGDRLLKDTATDVCILSWERDWANPWTFTSLYAKTEPKYKDLKMGDVLLCTTAAPTYFDPHPLTIDGVNYHFQDGGVAINNPCLKTTCYAMQNYPSHDFNQILSLGTGDVVRTEPRPAPKTWGLLGAGPEVITDLISSGVDLASDEMCSLFSHGTEDAVYHRLNPEITADHDALDDAEDSNLQYLQDRANQYVEDHHDLLRAIARNLLTYHDGDVYPSQLRA